MKNIYLILLLALLTGAMSCDHSLEEEPLMSIETANSSYFSQLPQQDPLLTRLVADLQAINKKKNFTHHLANTYGTPSWEATMALVNYRGTSLAYIPLVDWKKREVTAFLIAAYQNNRLTARVISEKNALKIKKRKKQPHLAHAGLFKALFFTAEHKLFNRGPNLLEMRMDKMLQAKTKKGAATATMRSSGCYAADTWTQVESGEWVHSDVYCVFEHDPWTGDGGGNDGGGNPDPWEDPWGDPWGEGDYDPWGDGTGSGDGGYSDPQPEPQPQPPLVYDITNDLQDPCMKAVLADIQAKDLKNDISKILRETFGVSDQVNITFFEDATLPNNVLGETSTTITADNTYNLFVALNSNVLGNASKEVIAETMIHEIIHAYLNANGAAKANLDHHMYMAQNYVEKVTTALREVFPNLSLTNAQALVLGGFGQIQADNPTYFNQLMGHYNTTANQVKALNDSYIAGNTGTACN